MKINLYQITKNLNEITIGPMGVFFSYKMPVAFRYPTIGICVRDCIDPFHLREVVTNKKYKIFNNGTFFKKLNAYEKKALKKILEK
jgi:hypothetical protein